MTAVLETDGLAKRYGRRWALRDCTLSIPEGKVVGLVGPNGAGKTTLLHLAVGLLAACRFGPFTVLGLFAGVVTDRFDNRHLMMATQIASMSIAAGLAAYAAVRFLVRWFQTRTLTPFGIYCVVFGAFCLIRFA